MSVSGADLVADFHRQHRALAEEVAARLAPLLRDVATRLVLTVHATGGKVTVKVEPPPESVGTTET